MSEKENETGRDDDAGEEAQFEDAIEGEVVAEDEATKGGSRLPLILAAVALLAVCAGLFLGYRYWTQMQQQLVELDASLQLANQQTLDLAQNLRQAQRDAEQQQASIAEQEQTLKAQHEQILAAKMESKRSGEALYRSLSEIQTRLGGKETQWRVAEAEYLLRVANHRLTLMADSETAGQALKAADERLGTTGDPGWAPVRELIAREITQINALPKVDQAGISAELGALAEQVSQLPLQNEGISLLADKRASEEQPKLAAEEGFDLQQVADDLWLGFKSMVEVRHHDKPVTAMLPPEQRYFLVQNLQLKLEAAKAALMGRNQTLYADNLNSAAQWVGTYFKSTDPGVNGFREQVEALAQRDVAPSLPDISASLRALQARRQRLNQEANQ
jgi:uroporphyrin-3 C-methyltransferase